MIAKFYDNPFLHDDIVAANPNLIMEPTELQTALKSKSKFVPIILAALGGICIIVYVVYEYKKFKKKKIHNQENQTFYNPPINPPNPSSPLSPI